jgi:hypothetical protein
MKKVILCSVLMAFAVATQADDAKKIEKPTNGKSSCCEEKTACCAKTVRKADSTAKAASFLVMK